jgi:hypothetical protein
VAPRYVTVSIPRAIADSIDGLIEGMGYWPSRSSFVREACLEKINLEINKHSVSGFADPSAVESRAGGLTRGSALDKRLDVLGIQYESSPKRIREV